MHWSLLSLVFMRFFCFINVAGAPEGSTRAYAYVKEKKTWSAAREYCQVHYDDLATIDNMEDNVKLYGSTDHGGKGIAWIGLNLVPGELNQWQWSLPGDKYGIETSHWNDGEPDNNNNNENCVAMRTDGKWFDTKCEKTLYAICYDEQNTTNKIQLIKRNMTWMNAQSYCRQHHTDLLGSVMNTENKNIQDMMKAMKAKAYWIGLFRDSWKWSDGSSSSFRNGLSEKSDKRCAVIRLNEPAKWTDMPCSADQPFFCNKNLILVRESMTWGEALNYCRTKHYDLVSVMDEKMQTLVQKKAKMAKTDYVWLGLLYTCTLDFWFWVSGDVSHYWNWAGGHRTRQDECGMTGAMRTDNFYWESQPDVKKFNFICI